jgi:uncharacterized membrane protein
MRSQASIGGHPLHPMLIVIPAGGFLLTFIMDLVHIATGNDLWWSATLPVLLVSVIGALVAAVPGLVDLVTVVPKGQATLTGLTHMVLNLALVVVAAINTWTRWSHDSLGVAIEGTPGWAWSFLGVGILAVSGWLGWRMVQTHHVGVLEVGEGGLPGEVPAEPRVLAGPLVEERSAH